MAVPYAVVRYGSPSFRYSVINPFKYSSFSNAIIKSTTEANDPKTRAEIFKFISEPIFKNLA